VFPDKCLAGLYAALLKHHQLLTDGLKQRKDNLKKAIQKYKNLCLYAALLKHHQLLTDGLKQRIDNSKKTIQKYLPLCRPSQASPAPYRWTEAKKR
jgi:hypothetical protein